MPPRRTIAEVEEAARQRIAEAEQAAEARAAAAEQAAEERAAAAELAAGERAAAAEVAAEARAAAAEQAAQERAAAAEQAARERSAGAQGAERARREAQEAAFEEVAGAVEADGEPEFDVGHVEHDGDGLEGSERDGEGGRGDRHHGLPPVRRVSLERVEVPTTPDEFLWWAIRNRQEAISWKRYERFVDSVLCVGGGVGGGDEFGGAGVKRLLNDIREDPSTAQALEGTHEIITGPAQYLDRVRGYQMLKDATEMFLMVEAGLAVTRHAERTKRTRVGEAISRLGPHDPLKLGDYERHEFRRRLREEYFRKLGDGARGLPYIQLILEKLVGLPTKPFELVHNANCYGIQYEEVSQPVMIELIWSYWMEQGMLVQTLAALSLRFQNKRHGDRDPLANLEIDPLRGVSNLLWGYIQDEGNRLTVQRRAYEYMHEYGLDLTGAAVPNVRAADRRSQFLRSFHDLLSRAYEFYQADDDTTVVADPFPVLTALQTLHMVLAEGAHNQFGDLPWTSRVEMLCQQWILARPELREFIGGRIMVPYREAWMDRVDAMRQLQGWGSVSITNYRDLATYGEMILLTVRWGEWSTIIDPDNAANWARAWRPMVQMYLNAYRVVTGVDLTAQSTASFQQNARYEQPAYLLERMLEASNGPRDGSRTRSRSGQISAPAR